MALTRRQFSRNALVAGLGIASAPAIGSLAGCASSASGTELKFSNVQPDTHYTNLAAEWMAGQLESATDDVTMKVFAGGALGGPDETLSSLNSGDVDLAWVSTGQLAREVPALNLFSAGYLIKDRDHFKRIATAGSPVFNLMRDLIESNVAGVRLVGIMGGPARNLYTTGDPVRTPADLDGRQIRVEDSPVKAQAWKAFGASPVPLDWSEIYTALQSDVIDGAESSSDAYDTNKFNEVATNLSLTRHEYGVLPVLMSTKAAEKLGSSDLDVVLDLASRASERCWDDGWKTVDELEAMTLPDAGVTVVEPDTEAFADTVDHLPAEVAAQYDGTKLLQAIQDA